MIEHDIDWRLGEHVVDDLGTSEGRGRSCLDGQDLHHSRMLDVHRTSEHPEAKALIDYVWDRWFTEAFPDKIGPGQRPKASYKKQFSVLLLDLFVTWKDDPTLCIGVGMKDADYKQDSRYNLLHISKNIRGVIYRASDVGLIDLWRGNKASQLRSRIWPREPLIELFQAARFGVLDVGRDQECIVLSRNKKERKGEPKRSVSYENTAETDEMRTRLERYNALLSRTFIDIPSCDDPFIEIPPKPTSKTGQPTRVSVSPTQKFVRRIFYRESFEYGGRFHGGWWQQMGSEYRALIHIDDEDTIEIDYSGLHIALLYALEAREMPEDPYRLPSVLNVSPEQQRKWVKLLVLTAINAASEKSAILAFLGEKEDDPTSFNLDYQSAKRLLDAFKSHNLPICHRFGSDEGVRLMNTDGKIASYVIDSFTDEGIPCLCAHDSFSVQSKHADRLVQTMKEAFRHVVLSESHLDQEARMKVATYKESFLQGMDLDRVLKYHNILSQAGNSSHTTEGYLKRMVEFENWLSSQGYQSKLDAKRQLEAYEDIYVYEGYL